MMIQHKMYEIAAYTDQTMAEWAKPKQSGLLREIGICVVPIIVTETLCFIATAYHSFTLTALAAKILFSIARSIFLYISSTEIQSLDSKVHWITWHQLKENYLLPLAQVSSLSLVTLPMAITSGLPPLVDIFQDLCTHSH